MKFSRNLVEFVRLPKNCIFVLVCDENKGVLVMHTGCLMDALYRINRDLETSKYTLLRNDIDKIRIEVLEEGIEDTTLRKIKTNNYLEEYLSKGYKQYCPSNLVKYKVCLDVITHNRTSHAIVYLKDKRCNKIVVGLFKNMREAKSFVQEYYPNYECKGIYYATNEATTKYLHEIKE
jgi:hypothetical protein